MSRQSPHPVIELLVRWKASDHTALEALIPLVCTELRDIARHVDIERDWNVAKVW